MKHEIRDKVILRYYIPKLAEWLLMANMTLYCLKTVRKPKTDSKSSFKIDDSIEDYLHEFKVYADEVLRLSNKYSRKDAGEKMPETFHKNSFNIDALKNAIKNSLNSLNSLSGDEQEKQETMKVIMNKSSLTEDEQVKMNEMLNKSSLTEDEQVKMNEMLNKIMNYLSRDKLEEEETGNGKDSQAPRD